LGLFLETYWDLERLGHLYIPVALSIESHGGDFGGDVVEDFEPSGFGRSRGNSSFKAKQT